MIISMETEGSRIERELRGEYIDELTQREFNYLKSLNDKDFFEWIRQDIVERFEDYDVDTLKNIINLIEEQDNDQ